MIRLVYGPPCGGKSTYVRERARPGDLVVDHDLIAQELGSPATHNHAEEYRALAEQRVAELLVEVANGRHRSVWVVRSVAEARFRQELADYIGADEVVLVTATRRELAQRARSRPDPDATLVEIDRWLRAAERKPPKRHPAWR
jgi:predicted kinase